MCFPLWDHIAGGMRCILVGLFVCLCLGPILILTGIILLTTDNTRQDDVDEYNAAATSYSQRDFITLSSTQLSKNFGNNGPFTRATEAVDVQGNLEGVDRANHIVYSTVDTVQSTSSSYQVTFTGPENANRGSVSYAIPYRREVTKPLFCRSAQCTRYCDDEDFQCEESAMRRLCQDQAPGASYRDDSGSCWTDEKCGDCTFTGYLNKACLVFRLDDNSQASASTRYTSCEYPFDTQEYGAQSNTVSFRAMSETDPYIALERITEGSRNFGITAEQQRNAGIACIVIGAILSAIVGGVIFFLLNNERQKKEQADLNAQQGGAEMQGEVPPTQPAYDNQPGPYGQQQQQQPAYGQPQPQYGQQPVYGQPVQQQQGYPPQQGQGYYGQPPPQQQQHVNKV